MILIIITIFFVGLILLSERSYYHCPKCDNKFTSKKCLKCGNCNGYSDRHSDSSLSIRESLKYFEKNKRD